MCVKQALICFHSQGCLHQSPSTPDRAPSCPPACSPSSPSPRSASLYLYDEPGWLAHSALHHAVKRKREETAFDLDWCEMYIMCITYITSIYFPNHALLLKQL